MKIQHALSTAAFAVALAFTGTAQATNIDSKSQTIYENDGANIFGETYAFITPWIVHNDNGHDYLAFCIDPLTGGDSDVTDYGSLVGDPSVIVQKLYETSYASVLYGTYHADKAAAFQLALWSVMNPGQVVLPTTGGNALSNLVATEAASMIALANDYGGPLGTYTYTTYTSGSGASQTVLSVGAVPEADTWAMLAAGLGLVGFMGRRHARKEEKFAA
jgi:hypothetical protein